MRTNFLNYQNVSSYFREITKRLQTSEIIRQEIEDLEQLLQGKIFVYLSKYCRNKIFGPKKKYVGFRFLLIKT